MRSLTAVLIAVAMVLPGAAYAQTLPLEEALRRADANSYMNRAAAAAARAQEGEALRPLQGVLPTVRLESGFARTTDPVGAFGTTLRQRVITQADFDPALLNQPAPISNYGAAIVLEQPLLNVDAHVGRRAAVRAADAAWAEAEWTRGRTGIDVVRAYYGGVLAQEQVVTLEAALEAARAHVKQAESLVAQGVVTRSDALLAQVKAGDIEAQLAAARGDAALVRRRIAVLFGAPADTSFELPAGLPARATVAAVERIGWHAAESGRADVRAAMAGSEAARLDAARARATLLPRLNGVARYDWNSAAAPFRGQENWSIGVMATWTPFSGAAELGAMRAASGRAAAAGARAEAARAQAELDEEASANSWRVALERMAIGENALVQAAEAHRIVTRMYAGGLATATELLGAAATETEARLRFAAARYDAIVAAAERLHALGRSVHELAEQLAMDES
jgi:outer membrane protein TolC